MIYIFLLKDSDMPFTRLFSSTGRTDDAIFLVPVKSPMPNTTRKCTCQTETELYFIKKLDK